MQIICAYPACVCLTRSVSLLVYHLFSFCPLQPPSSANPLLANFLFLCLSLQHSSFLCSLLLLTPFCQPTYPFSIPSSCLFLPFFLLLSSCTASRVLHSLIAFGGSLSINVPSTPPGSFKPLQVCSALNLALVLLQQYSAIQY